MFEQFTGNKGNRSRGETLEGRKLRVVVVEVMTAVHGTTNAPLRLIKTTL